MKNLQKKKNYTIATLVVVFCVSAVSVAMGQNKELVETLLENGHLTQDQAVRLMNPDRPGIVPAGTNFKDFRIRGRIQTQFGYVNSKDDTGSEAYSTGELRRVRLGAQGTLLQNVRAQLEMNLVPGSAVSMRSAFLQWREHDIAHVKVGFDRPAFGLERTTSSASIYTVERSHLTNTIISNDALGVAVDGKLSPFVYGVGVYTNRDGANPAGNARYLYNARVGMNLDDRISAGHKLSLFADAIFNDDDGGNIGFDKGYSLGAQYGFGAFGLSVEYLTAESFAGDTTHGWYFLPSYFITDKWQVVGRYEWMESDAANGIHSPSRYAHRVGDLRGDGYQAIYVGVNYYIRGDANKLMFGLETSELDNTPAGDQESLTLYAAWRVLF